MNQPTSETQGELAPNYVIRWKSKITGKTGGGMARFFKQMAMRIVSRANYNHPYLDHWIEVT